MHKYVSLQIRAKCINIHLKKKQKGFKGRKDSKQS